MMALHATAAFIYAAHLIAVGIGSVICVAVFAAGLYLILTGCLLRQALRGLHWIAYSLKMQG